MRLHFGFEHSTSVNLNGHSEALLNIRIIYKSFDNLNLFFSVCFIVVFR